MLNKTTDPNSNPSLRSRHQSNPHNATSIQDPSLLSRLQQIQQNKSILQSKLLKLSNTQYIPSNISPSPQPTDPRRNTNTNLYKRTPTPNSSHPSSNDFNKVEIEKPRFYEIYKNDIRDEGGDGITEKLRGIGDGKKLGINELNKIRMEIHEKQEMLMKRKFVYRETEAMAPEELDKVMEMNPLEIDEAIKNTNIDIDDYRNPIPKELLLTQLPRIQKNTEQRLKIFKGEIEVDTSEETKRYNKKYLAQQNAKSVGVAREILNELIDQAVGYYECLAEKLRLHVGGEEDLRRHPNVDDLILQGVYGKIIGKILKEFHRETYEEVNGLRGLADEKLVEIFGGTYRDGSKRWEGEVLANYEIKLNYREQEVEESGGEGEGSQEEVAEYESVSRSSNGSIQPPKKKPRFQQPKKNIPTPQPPLNKNPESKPPKRRLSTPQKKKQMSDKYKSKLPHSNSSLSNPPTSQNFNPKKPAPPPSIPQQSQQQTPDDPVQALFIRQQQKYFQNVEADFVQIIDRTYDSKRLLIQNGIYLISPKYIKNIREEIIMPNPYHKNLLGYKKFNAYWGVFSESEVTVMHPWHSEKLSVHHGSRPGRLADKISYIEFYPITTLLGNVTAILIGFENGIIVKYNFNRDPMNGKQTGDAFFEPLIPHKIVDKEPPLPGEFKELVSFPRGTANGELHRFREFFDFHTKKIIGIHFYSIVEFISIDVSMTCGVWNCIDDEVTPIDTFVIDDTQSYFRANKNKSSQVEINEDETKMYNRLFNTNEGLINQIFNDPEQNFAYYYPQLPKSGIDTPLWKVFYSNQKVTKIIQQHFDQKTNTPRALSACLWNSNLFILTCRQHPIDPNYNTYRVICWNISKKKKKPVRYQLHLQKGEDQPIFLISDSIFDIHENSCPALFMMNPGRVMMYSLLTGQLIRNVGDANMMDDPLGFYHFATAANTAIVLVGDSGIHRMTFEDKNTPQAQGKYLKEIRELVSKFLK